MHNTSLQGAVAFRVLPRSSILLQSGLSLAGTTRFQAQTEINGIAVDVGPGLPYVRNLEEAMTPAGSWVVSLAWQQQLGPLHVRAGYGLSKIPYAWLPQAVAADLRWGIFPERKRDR